MTNLTRPAPLPDTHKHQPNSQRRARIGNRNSHQVMFYGFLLPAIVLTLLFTIYPLIQSLQLMFQRWPGYGKPVQVEERFVNPQLAQDYLQQDFSQLTPHEYLSRVAPLTEARHTIEAVSPTDQVCEWLQLYNEEPCLQLIRRTSSQQGVVCFARIIYPGSSYRLGGQLTFNKKK